MTMVTWRLMIFSIQCPPMGKYVMTSDRCVESSGTGICKLLGRLYIRAEYPGFCSSQSWYTCKNRKVHRNIQDIWIQDSSSIRYMEEKSPTCVFSVWRQTGVMKPPQYTSFPQNMRTMLGIVCCAQSSIIKYGCCWPCRNENLMSF